AVVVKADALATEIAAEILDLAQLPAGQARAVGRRVVAQLRELAVDAGAEGARAVGGAAGASRVDNDVLVVRERGAIGHVGGEGAAAQHERAQDAEHFTHRRSPRDGRDALSQVRIAGSLSGRGRWLKTPANHGAAAPRSPI